MITSIDSNNLPQAVIYINSRIFKFQQSKRAYKIAVLIWATIFFPLFCIFTYGATESFIFKGHPEIEIPVLSSIWHWFYNLILPVVDLAVWYWFAALVVIHVCFLPLIVGLIVKLVVSKKYSPDVSELTLDTNNKPNPRTLSKKAKAFEYPRFAVGAFKFCLAFDIAYVIGIIGCFLYMNWSALAAAGSNPIWILILKILVGILILTIAFFAFWGLMALSYRICTALVTIKSDSDFVAACAGYVVECDIIERSRSVSSEFDIGKYNKRMGISLNSTPQPNTSVQSTNPAQTSFNHSSPTSTPYVSFEEKVAAENAYYSGKLSNEELNKIITSYWEHHTNDDDWPDVGDG
ncbi:MAG: hypothetical protein IJY82_00740 [Oscillospiraceae bacterium]|nr:hypothetical protein [Oscillospiraceae bacterium]